MTSTNGTWSTAALHTSGRWLSTAPISSPPALAVLLLHQEVGAGDEVGERVLLAEQLPAVVPRPAEVAAAADVGLGEDHPAVEHRHPARVEPDRRRRAVRPVPGQQARRRA